MPEEVAKKTEKELDRLQKMQSGSAEGSVIRNSSEEDVYDVVEVEIKVD